MCVDDKFSKPFKSYLADDVYNFINNMIEKANNVMMQWKKYFNKELVIKRIIKVLTNFNRNNAYIEVDVKSKRSLSRH